MASWALAGGPSLADESPLPIGRTAPPLALSTLDHGPQGLAALQGKAVLVHFFATWCEPCREEMAGLTRLNEKLADRPFAILAIDVGEVEVRVRRFFEANPVAFPVLLDEDRAVTKTWKVVGLPSSFLLDPSHTLRLYAGGPVDWDHTEALRLVESLLLPAALPAGAALPPLNE